MTQFRPKYLTLDDTGLVDQQRCVGAQAGDVEVIFLTCCDKVTSKEPHRDSGATLVGVDPPTAVVVQPPLTVRFPGKGTGNSAPPPNVVPIPSHLLKVCMC